MTNDKKIEKLVEQNKKLIDLVEGLYSATVFLYDELYIHQRDDVEIELWGKNTTPVLEEYCRYKDTEFNKKKIH